MARTLHFSVRWLIGSRALGLGLLALAMTLMACGGSGGDSSDAADAAGVRVTENIDAGDRRAPEPTATRVPAGVTPEARVAPEDAVAPTRVPALEPDLFVEAGPYAAGVITVELADRSVEIWYPVQPLVVQGESTEIFNALSGFPEALQPLIPAELAGDFDTGAFRDAEAADGTFPVAIYSHGFGGFRQVATSYATHLASWGYIVPSIDHRERGLAEQSLDLLGSGLFDEENTRPEPALTDVRDLIARLDEMANDGGPLSGRLDTSRIAIAGHSAGGWTAVQSALGEPDRITTWISIAGGALDTAPPQPGLVVIAELDAVVEPERSYDLFESVTARTILVNIAEAGHNSFTDACFGIRDLGGLGSLTALLGEAQVARADDGCVESFLPPEDAQNLLNHLTVAHLRSEFEQGFTPPSLDPNVLGEITPLADFQVGPTR